MRRFALTLTAAAAVLTAGAFAPGSVSAAPISAPTGVLLGLDGAVPIENVAICFYLNGWNGPGMYECGYRRRQGQGWHGRREGVNEHGRRNDRNRRGDNGRNNSNEWRSQ